MLTFNEYHSLICESALFDEFDQLYIAAKHSIRKRHPYYDELLKTMKLIKVYNYEDLAKGKLPEGVDQQDANTALQKWQEEGAPLSEWLETLRANAAARNFVILPNVSTMAVDANGNIFVNVDFTLNTLKRNEIVSVLIHEILHVALHHPTRAGDRRRQEGGKLWNIAIDICVNHIILLDGLPLPEPRSAGGEIDIILPTRDGDWTIPAESSFGVTKSGQDEHINILDKRSGHTKPAEAIYAILYDLVDPSGTPGGIPPPKPLKVGDIIRMKDGRHGQITQVDPAGKNHKVKELSQAEAKRIVRRRGQFGGMR